ncbi:Methyltransferase domain-containing protein [Formivibrio citricus]|uniref:Arsenite methyltransferase n=1 Tax=Formivibrio citricus TaxID=83765 RepID=A0A1I4WHM3_9NEIS|nr:arsenite methyltransferase [Formivibrio citricus]SFN13178.1 Methyltransferase domain-containing protein [Formivibrio citricus]
MRNKHDFRNAIRRNYAQVARGQGGCGCAASSCCAGPAAVDSRHLGYEAGDLDALPAGADMGLGCGNPLAIASLKPGQIVLDLGCGGGLDVLLAARQVGEAGRVIGVDMTPEMLDKARSHASRAGLGNVEFRLGEIESLPVADGAVDVILSNCVINLSPDKPAAFREAFRVLRPGGRLAISDIVALAPLPPELAGDFAAFAGCVAGAVTVAELEQMLAAIGFEQVAIHVRPESREFIKDWFPGRGMEAHVASATIEACKPA